MARISAARAVQLDPKVAEARVSSAWIKFSFDWDFRGAEEELKVAIKLKPALATAHHWYALYLSGMDRPNEAIAEIELARRLEPLSLVINRDVGWVYYRARQFGPAIEAYQRTLELAPSFYIAHYFFGETYEQMGKTEEAVAEFRETKSHIKEGTQVWTLLAQARAQRLLGNGPEALRTIND
jgi:tetratricopeptide (TPR) repeat protein